MVGRTIGRFGLLMLAGGLFAASAVTAQTSPSPGTDDLRRKVAEGTEFCRKTLASAPPDIKIGEVEEFCACMGVQEAAMGEMAEAGKASLRPQLQQMCVGTLRSRQGQSAASPAPAVQPAFPPSSPPAAPVPPATAPAPDSSSAGSSVAALPPAVVKIEQWTINTNITGAPVAYVRATDTPSIAAFIMYCRAKDAIGFRVRFKSGFAEKHISFPMGGWDIGFDVDKNGVVPQAAWANFVKNWLETEKHTPAEVRKRPDYSGMMDITAQRRIIGKANLDGLTETREKMRGLCAEAIARGAPEGNYLTTGLVAFDPEVLVGTAPTGTPAGVPVVAPRAPAVEAKPKPVARCTITEAQVKAAFDQESYQFRERIKAEFMRLGYLPKETSCANMRRLNAFHQEVIKRVGACEAMPSRNKIIAEHRGHMAKNNDSIRRNNWCG